MDERARKWLTKLLLAAEKHGAGVRMRNAALTKAQLKEYQAERSIHAKEAVEATLTAAEAEGAVRLEWDGPDRSEAFIERVEVVNLRALSMFLGEVPLADLVADARSRFAPHLDRYPVLEDVLQRWATLRTVRSLSGVSVPEWLDAITVIEASDKFGSDDARIPIREASGRLFRNTKRIERLAAPIDVLLCGSVEAPAREPAEVWAELGLFREERPALLAGNVVVRRQRHTAVLDAPYSGLSPVSVLGLGSAPTEVMTIENLTTFHREAGRRFDESVLLIYTAGMPSPIWRAMYGRLLSEVPADTPVYHWGDVDEGGFRIAAALAAVASEAGHVLRPWRMHPSDVPDAARREATSYVLGRVRHFATQAGWQDLGDAVFEVRFTAEQESLVDQ